MTSLTPEEARQALADIDGVSRQMRQILHGDGLVSAVLLLWGGLWILIFGLGYLTYPHGDRFAWVLNAIGFAGTAWLVAKHQRQVRSEGQNAVLQQIAMIWLTLIVFAFLLPVALRIPAWHTRLALMLSLLMLGYVIQGIWLKDGVFAGLGLFIILSILACHAWLSPRNFLAGLGVFGGGGLCVGGLIIRFRWR